MKETSEKVVRVGLKRKAKDIFDEIEFETAGMIRNGWILRESVMEECLGNVHLIFERELSEVLF
jgi:hypothetical protein